MVKILTVLLILSIIGNIIGAYYFYKYSRARNTIDDLSGSLENANDVLDRFFSKRMVFLHHSVGYGILNKGGLRDSLMEMGVLVKSATYGDDIGNLTNMGHWSSKFLNNMDLILSFKGHPNKYYRDNTRNDIVMFKSCFPNSDIQGEGVEPGQPSSNEKTIANYKAVFNTLKEAISKQKDRLFIYMTSPPLVPEATSKEAAARAREFNKWLMDDFIPAYRTENKSDNFVVFDLYGVLADDDGFLRKEFRVGVSGDSHPNERANKTVAQKFMEFFRPIWSEWEQKQGAVSGS